MRVSFRNFAFVLALYFDLDVSITEMKNKILTSFKSLLSKKARA